MTEIAPVPRLLGAQLVYGGSESLQTMVDVAETATKSLDIDIFAGSHPTTLNALTKQRPGVDTLFLLDPEVSGNIRAQVAGTGGQVVDTGVMPAKNHVKAVVADGQRATVTTAALAPRTPQRFEVAAKFEGEAAGALHDLSRATATGDSAAISAAAKTARTHGIVVNDAAHGVWELSDEVYDMVGTAKHDLQIATKRLEEPRLLEMIKEAKARGVNVDIAKKSGRGGVPLHANIVIADDTRAYIGSGHLTKRVLTGGGTNGRLSREMGVVIEDTGQISKLKTELLGRGYLHGPKVEAKIAQAAVNDLHPQLAEGILAHAAEAPARRGVAAAAHGMPALLKVGIVGGVLAGVGAGVYLLTRPGSKG